MWDSMSVQRIWRVPMPMTQELSFGSILVSEADLGEQPLWRGQAGRHSPAVYLAPTV